MRATWITGFFLLLTGAAFAQSKPWRERPEFACGPLDAKFSTRTRHQMPPGPVAAGKARVYVVEDWLPPGAALLPEATIRVAIDGRWVGATHGNSYTYFDAAPGEHHVCVNWQPGFLGGANTIALYGFHAEDQQTYFFRVRNLFYTSFGQTGSAGLTSLLLEPLNSDEGKYLIEQYPHSTARTTK